MTLKKTGYEFWRDVLGNPQYVVAPMVDMSELPFRELCRHYNAEVCYTPMLHSQQFLQDSLYRSDSFSTSHSDRPLIVQFCANDPSVFVDAAVLVASQCDAIDLNLGCPQAIAKKGHYGAFLQDEWDLIRSILRKGSTDLPVPVTCKMRILPGPSIQSVEYAKMLEDAGCSVLTVHGRTRFQKGHDTGLASWDVIKDIKQSVHIPVIANGNILTFDDVQACLKYTGADAVMSAEGLLHNPALFTGTNPPVWEMAEEYLALAEKYQTPFRYVRNHMYRLLYLCLHQDDDLRVLLENASTFEDFYSICNYLKSFPLKVAKEQDLFEEQKLDSFLSLDDKVLDDLHIADLFSPYAFLRESESFALKHFMNSNSENSFCYDSVTLVENLRSLYPSLDSESTQDQILPKLPLSENGSYPVEQTYLPVWLCHSRPRISVSGNRGCYSKYFSNMGEQKEKLGTEDEGTYLSKRQQRKARHYTRVLAAMKENRKAKKLRRKQKLLELRESNCNEMKVKMGERIPRKELKQTIKQRLIAAQGKSPKICIDMGFSSEMNSKELNRLSTQLRRLYGSNRKSEKPVHLYFCNFSKLDPLYEVCTSKNDGFSYYVVDMVETSPEETFSLNDLVYLSPDSENVLQTLDENKVYVIGGIVDGSVKKGLTLGHAASLEVQTARLPIREHLISCGSGTTVLTVNQVFDVLLKFYETGDWVQALSAGVPQRKGFRAPEPKPESPASSRGVILSRDSTTELMA